MKAKPILVLMAGFFAVAALVALLHFISPRLPGAAGKVFSEVQERDIEASALLYSEAGPVSEFLCPGGRYFLEPG